MATTVACSATRAPSNSGSRAVVQHAITSARSTASAGAGDASHSAANAASRSGSRAVTSTRSIGSTARSAATCARACGPVP
jgi:hypothetical protein